MEPSILIGEDWDTLEAHHKFMNDPSYAPFTSHLRPLCEDLYLHHFTPSTFPPGIVASSPVIEFATFFNVEPRFPANVEKFIGVLDKGKPEGYLGGVFGEVIEEIANGGKEEGKGKAVRLCLGWTSKDEHMKFRDTPLFKNNIQLLREGVGSVELVHVPFKAR